MRKLLWSQCNTPVFEQIAEAVKRKAQDGYAVGKKKCIQVQLHGRKGSLFGLISAEEIFQTNHPQIS